MKISIVTVSYNSADTIADAMESVARQMRSGFEVTAWAVDVEAERFAEPCCRDAGSGFMV